MVLTPGTRLGPYEVAALLGAGGMGEVYQARDARLQRDVAIKVLPDEILGDSRRRARFEREARTLAALSHSGIAAIYAFEEIAGRAVLVMELASGEPLDARIARGALPVDEALSIARQIAEAVEAAHEKGIIHRDLKPANIHLTAGGKVKLLDFGLAKAFEAESVASSPDITHTPTLASAGTAVGLILGTPGYMSPEQARGKPVDKRADIWAFGVVLYEMLTGHRAFPGETPSDVIAAVLTQEPEWKALPAGTPRAVTLLLHRCLARDAANRLHDIADARIELTEPSTGSGETFSGAPGRVSADGEGRFRFRLAVLGSVAVGGVLLGALVAGVLVRPRAAGPPDFQVLTTSGNDTQPSASPDGKTIAFTSSRDGTRRIWLKQRAGGAEAVLTTGGPDSSPRFSPDGSAVLFVRGVADESAIYRVPLVGGEVRKVVGQATEADWSPDGREIGFLRVEVREGKVASSVHRIVVDGTNERVIARVTDHVLNRPRWSPDGLTLAAIEVQGTGTGRPRIVLFPLDGEAPRRLEVPETGIVRGIAWNGDSRHLILVGNGSASALGSRTTRVFLKDTRTGKTRVLLSGIDLGGSVDVSGPGSLVLVTGGRRSNLRETSLTKPGEASRWLTRGSSVDRQPVYAPDGEWVAFTSNRSGNNDVWEVSTRSGAVRRLTDDSADDFDPAFTRDGKHLLFSSNRSGHFEIWMAERDGTAPRRITSDGVDAENPTATPDGQWIVYASGNPEKRGVWKVRADGSAATRLAGGALILPEISPDGRLVSYATAGGREAFIRVVRLEDGAPVPFEVMAAPHLAGPVVEVEVGRELPGTGFNRGRHRWMPNGGAFVFLTDDEKGDFGIAMQDVTPDGDSRANGTRVTRRFVTGFTPDSVTESLGVAPDGTRLMVGELQVFTSLLLAEGVEGVVARTAREAR